MAIDENLILSFYDELEELNPYESVEWLVETTAAKSGQEAEDILGILSDRIKERV